MYALTMDQIDMVSGGQSDALTGSEVMVGVAVAAIAAAPVVAVVAAGAAIAAAGIAIYQEL